MLRYDQAFEDGHVVSPTKPPRTHPVVPTRIGTLDAVTFAVGPAGVGAMHGILTGAKVLLFSVVTAAVGILVAAMLIFATNNVPVGRC